MLGASADAALVRPANRVAGGVRVPGDKSISHRYAMLAAIADGASTFTGYASGADCRATLACLQSLGVAITESSDGMLTIEGRGVRGLVTSTETLDAANSGTTMRLLAGILAAHRMRVTITGDSSLVRRPMRRVIDPLTRMGAQIVSNDGKPPLTIAGADLRSITHHPDVPSAQVKSAVLLAGLQATGTTTVVEPAATRDHTERALQAFGAAVDRQGSTISISGGQRLGARRLQIPGDISSAVFWMALAVATPGGSIRIEGVGLNPTRTAVLELLRRAGGRIIVDVNGDEAGEPTGVVDASYGQPRSFTIEPDEVPAVIDEIPALAALTAMMPAGHELTVRGAGELRVKESDRISSLARGLRTLGAVIQEYPDGFRLQSRRLVGASVDAEGDHRLAMAFGIAATAASAPVTIAGASSAEVSYPGFFEELSRLTRGDAR